MDRPELARRIKAVCYLTGEFKLRSGKTSPTYWDKYRFESDPEILGEIAGHLEGLLPTQFDALAGLELGGVPIATALSLRTGRPCLFVRKEAKEYGTCNLVEGGLRTGLELVAVEDVVTTAGQLRESICQIRELGFQVETALCVIDREQGGRESLQEIGCDLRSLFRLSEIEELVGSS